MRRHRSTHTTKSKILNDDWKYWLIPNPYIFNNISKTNKPRKTNSAMSEMWRTLFPEIFDGETNLTQEIRQILFLSIVFNGDTCGIEKDQDDHCPIECLGFDQNSNFTPRGIGHRSNVSLSVWCRTSSLDDALLQMPTAWKGPWTIRSFHSRPSSSVKSNVYKSRDSSEPFDSFVNDWPISSSSSSTLCCLPVRVCRIFFNSAYFLARSTSMSVVTRMKRIYLRGSLVVPVPLSVVHWV